MLNNKQNNTHHTKRKKPPRWLTMLTGTLSSLFLLSVLPISQPVSAIEADQANSSHEIQAPPLLSLSSELRGQAAIDALGPHLPKLADYYGLGLDELKNMLLNDQHTWIDKQGRLFYMELGDIPEYGSTAVNPSVTVTTLSTPQHGGTSVAVSTTSSASKPAYPLDQTFKLQSRPGSKRTVYLDFRGSTVVGTAWNVNYRTNFIQAQPFDIDGIPSSFSTTEHAIMQNIWRRVVDDFSAFDVNITTQNPGFDALNRSTSLDQHYGMRVIVTRDWTRKSPRGFCNCGGFAYLGSFNHGFDYYKPAFVFSDTLMRSEKNIAEAISHEIGHTVGLVHSGTTSSAYFGGYGSGQTGWAPIMGVGYNKNLVQWSRGEYSGSNTKQDAYATMARFGLIPLADDHGNSPEQARSLNRIYMNGRGQFEALGTIEQPSDTDVFRIYGNAGSWTLSALPRGLSPNLDIALKIMDTSGKIVSQVNNINVLSASQTVHLPAGTYFVAVKGTGQGNPSTDGYSNYGSIGRYGLKIVAPL